MRRRNNRPGPVWTTCGGCGARWTGLNTCHCGKCHLTLTSISAFDKHRLRGRCCDPQQRGLVPVDKKYWSGWGLPGENPRGGED